MLDARLPMQEEKEYEDAEEKEEDEEKQEEDEEKGRRGRRSSAFPGRLSIGFPRFPLRLSIAVAFVWRFSPPPLDRCCLCLAPFPSASRSLLVLSGAFPLRLSIAVGFVWRLSPPPLDRCCFCLALFPSASW